LKANYNEPFNADAAPVPSQPPGEIPSRAIAAEPLPRGGLARQIEFEEILISLLRSYSEACFHFIPASRSFQIL
jgi:hypothetical protein